MGFDLSKWVIAKGMSSFKVTLEKDLRNICCWIYLGKGKVEIGYMVWSGFYLDNNPFKERKWEERLCFGQYQILKLKEYDVFGLGYFGFWYL